MLSPCPKCGGALTQRPATPTRIQPAAPLTWQREVACATCQTWAPLFASTTVESAIATWTTETDYADDRGAG